MTDQQVKEWLVRYGRHLCPQVTDLNGGEIDADLFLRLPMASKYVEAAIRDVQHWFAEPLNWLCMRYHERNLIADGVALEATRDFMGRPRCGVGDYFSREVEEARWPDACKDNLVIARTFQSLPGLTREATDSVFDDVASEWTNALNVTIRNDGVQDSGTPDARLSLVALKRLSGGTLAWQVLAIDRCNFVSDGAMDSGRNWSLPLALGVAKHEAGHWLGLRHVPGPIDGVQPTMNPYMDSDIIGRNGALTVHDIDAGVALGYEREDSPPPSGDWVTGELTLGYGARFRPDEPDWTPIGTCRIEPTSDLKDIPTGEDPVFDPQQMVQVTTNDGRVVHYRLIRHVPLMK